MKGIWTLIVLLYGLVVAQNGQAQPQTISAFSMAGLWQSESGSELKIYLHESEFLGFKQIFYVDEQNQRTGQTIDYFYSFEKDLSGQWIGNLETYDSYYGCSLENGEIDVVVLSDQFIQLKVPVIRFKKVTIGPSRWIWKREPIRCQSRWGEYVCGWHRVRRRVVSGGISHCEITHRQWQIIQLEKKADFEN